MNDDFIYQIVATYHLTGSLRKTADEMGLSLSTIRKALITYGAYSTPFSEEVFSLHCKGCSVEDIAKALSTTAKRVIAWLPYEKGMYNTVEKTQDAVRSDNYRKRIKQAQINSVQNKIKNDKKETFDIINNNRVNFFPMDTIRKETDQSSNPIRLHLKLENKYPDSESKRLLRKYGRSSTGTSIERDILIPSDMTLHALHYAIQRLYGWQNSRLRSFKLPTEVYKELTGNTVKGWGNLIGVLFQTTYPEYAQSARYGDDDYEGGSHKTWLRKKYTGPYGYLNDFERYDIATAEFEKFVSHFSNMAVYEPFDFSKANKSREEQIIKYSPVIDLTLDELNASIIMEEGTEDLLERLTVASVLASTEMRTADLSDLNKSMIKRLYNNDFTEIEEPEVKPVTNKLIYSYDYGDGWEIEITRLTSCKDLLEEGLISDEELMYAHNTVIEKHKPACMHQDGIFAVDDVGGFSGFVDLLKTLYESDDAYEKEYMRTWSSGMGWNTRKVKNSEML